MKNISEILKSLREEKNISMDEMAEQLKKYGVNPSKSMISRWENGKAEPSMSYVRILAKYFNVTLDYLLGLDSEEKSNKENQINTLAAHLEGKDLTPQKMKLLEKYIDALFDDED
ncbi:MULTISPECIES: helix-turn-helix domain-containing protein [Clostridium]|uniref:helix-turn-helix domain-containing protein n=1 Tax=Clostridium TaxID=1485 RepID=UPI00069E2F6E|nr:MULTISPECIES: helix-turn-helix transcriptional regulator [Clostridium]KOF56646.1 hypothetical protein AGR56_07915 [Clostridium sp. DMHC 10]MCD2348106.1 helix-turn-helix domain-containing protein [Clostridium guangxiense]